MAKKKVTIRMPRKYLRRWLTALRSGKYKQTSSMLYDPETNGFCCLGVLQSCITGGMVEGTPERGFRSMPSYQWLDEHGIEFYSIHNTITLDPVLTDYDAASYCNDVRKLSFPEIADLIEKCSEGY